jgi:diguanylate cyclase (GGDEF)-like protein
MKRAGVRALQGMAMAPGAPLGWLLIRTMNGAAPAAELAAEPGLYIYMAFGTLGIFALFGFILGEKEDRLERSNRALEDLAITDALTGLRNRRYFHARLDEEQAERRRTGAPLALAIIDLDYFKRVNDQHGHVAGDNVLITVARAISSVTRQGETEARVGGEEFALLLPESDAAAGRDAAERVRNAIAAAETRLREGPAIRITASAGVASTAEMPDATSTELYRAADRALYAAKAAGRNRTVVAGARDSMEYQQDVLTGTREADHE